MCSFFSSILNNSLGYIIILLYYQLTPCVPKEFTRKRNIDDENEGDRRTNLHLHVSTINPSVFFPPSCDPSGEAQ